MRADQLIDFSRFLQEHNITDIVLCSNLFVVLYYIHIHVLSANIYYFSSPFIPSSLLYSTVYLIFRRNGYGVKKRWKHDVNRYITPPIPFSIKGLLPTVLLVSILALYPSLVSLSTISPYSTLLPIAYFATAYQAIIKDTDLSHKPCRQRNIFYIIL